MKYAPQTIGLPLGVLQILAWGTTFYMPTVLSVSIIADTGWPLWAVSAGLTIALLTAALVSPYVGRSLARGRKVVMVLAPAFMAGGLVVLSGGQHLFLFWLGWAIVGVGMGCGLYDAAFAILGHYYGRASRAAVPLIAILGGLSSSIGWPVGLALEGAVGWQGTCLVYAAAHLLIGIPLALDTAHRLPAPPKETAASDVGEVMATGVKPAFALLAMVFVITTAVSTNVIVHLGAILTAADIASDDAVALMAMVGLSQVAARLLLLILGKRTGPFWTINFTCALLALAIAVFAANGWGLTVAVVAFGMGIGLNSIARGLLPLHLLAGPHLARLMGWLGALLMTSQAVAPLMGALIIDAFGLAALMAGLLQLSALAMATALFLTLRHGRKSP
ncbi:MFS transporter [Pelagibacterium lacus]|uniref:MFS transporter n=1 Tax=Pelagibacterium lacus TaxID=2282655 RepID=A0A369W1P7_9HYPH|nr:MFS transporter [Pelagibacterium lacus]RDE07877.1 MFS transporter [Pelagibacterium lacus]